MISAIKKHLTHEYSKNNFHPKTENAVIKSSKGGGDLFRGKNKNERTSRKRQGLVKR